MSTKEMTVLLYVQVSDLYALTDDGNIRSAEVEYMIDYCELGFDNWKPVQEEPFILNGKVSHSPYILVHRHNAELELSTGEVPIYHLRVISHTSKKEPRLYVRPTPYEEPPQPKPEHYEDKLPMREHAVFMEVDGVELQSIIAATILDRPCLLLLSEEHMGTLSIDELYRPGAPIYPNKTDTVIWLDAPYHANTLLHIVSQASPTSLIEDHTESEDDDFNNDITEDADIPSEGTRPLPAGSGKRLIHRSGDGSKREPKLQSPRDSLRMGDGEESE